MQLAATLELYAGGPGSGCTGPNCGRPKGPFDGISGPIKQLKPGESTQDAWKDKNGNYLPERAMFHEQIVAALMAGKTSYVGQPQATLLGGGTASGKTTASRAIMGEDKNVVRIDPDEIKTAIPEFAGLKKEDQLTAALRVHDESKDITKMVLAQCIARHMDIVYDSTTSGNGGVELAKTLAKNGYEVHALFVDVPMEIAKERALARERSSADPVNNGRHVSDDVIEATHKGAAEKFMELKDSPAIATKRFYDNSAQVARLVYERNTLGPEKIYDTGRWAQYVKKATA